MRTNAMKKCAAGAVVIGGTFGALQSAAAGLTWSANNEGTWGDVPQIYLNLVSGGIARPNAELSSFAPYTLTRDPSDPLQDVVGNSSMNFSGLTYCRAGCESSRPFGFQGTPPRDLGGVFAFWPTFRRIARATPRGPRLCRSACP